MDPSSTQSGEDGPSVDDEGERSTMHRSKMLHVVVVEVEGEAVREPEEDKGRMLLISSPILIIEKLKAGTEDAQSI